MKPYLLLTKILALSLLVRMSWCSEHRYRHYRARNSKSDTTTYRLHAHLMDGYLKTTRPVKHPSVPITVKLTSFLYQVISLDQVKNTIKVAGSFELYWLDEFLTWNPADFGGTESIFLSSDTIWTPELSLYYSHNTEDNRVVLRTDNDARLNYTGMLRYFVSFTTESICQVNVALFPFDTQSCSLYFGSWAHSNDSLRFKLYSKLDFVDFFDNQEWMLVNNKTGIIEDQWLYQYLGEDLYWDILVLTVVLKRQSFYYIFNLVIPSTIIAVVSVIGFHTPSTSGRVRDAKFRLGIMTLMSMAVILLAIVEDMPKFGMQSRKTENKKPNSFSSVPLVGLFYFCILTVIGFSTCTTSVFVFLERNVRNQRQIPWYLKWAAFRCTDCAPRRKYRGYDTPDSALLQVNYMAENEDGDTPRSALRKRLSIAHYDNLVLYHYFHQVLEDITNAITSIDASLSHIRHELLSLLPRDDLDNRWYQVIRRLELLSLAFYLSCILIIVIMFFKHQWYIDLLCEANSTDKACEIANA